MKHYERILSAVIVATLTACSGGKNNSTLVTSTPATATMRNLSAANFDSSVFPWQPGVGAAMSKRWQTPIPVKTNGDARADEAMTAIELRLGQTIFDRTSIQAADASTVTRGIIFSQNTAYNPHGPACGNVASGPNVGAYPSSFYNGTTGIISARLYVNLDSSNCTASGDVVIHELGHALGLGAHFEGFGNGPAINEAFWAALKTLYGNPVGTAQSNIQIVN